MSNKAMSLKARIKNLAKQKDMSAQVVLQNYMFERFLERLSKSQYKNKLILKGGMLIAAIVGIDNRATMDMDATIKNYPLNIESLSKAIIDICLIDVDDNVKFSFLGTQPIREDNHYGGLRVSIQADYDTIITPMQIDVTTGNAITPKEILYSFKMIFNDGTIEVWAYNIETVLAEKYETILRRGQLNTRPRDFYDIYILAKTQDFDKELFADAVRKTSANRGTTHIFEDIENRINNIGNSEDFKKQWMKYTKNYRYAEDISYGDIIEILNMLTLNIK
ncbi:Predicted nucleotidyltransferase component of viral defense system [Anaerovirgula multivorans]|uniref:Predicted nucleotidyltransferase component of viral defense system n=1 Tax=Anaerovirgula multivorans TaxID=312168 RepID=A0A239CJG1_9FIRM|nr:nucleotidyl transferase AbiEii/AbiGii toxin family protein [Anaerovirgula multivorans]SNS20250.1 Predicted nucleotidyltransferase component of viral defense system [Anaerovirgula multivorans]